jgi:hypothetical protein
MAKGLGGTITEVEIDGVFYRVHTFINSGNFQVTFPGTFEYLVLAGGGGGGVGGGTAGAGGGGAGGLIVTSSSLSLGTYPVIVGDGGPANWNDLAGEDGLNGANSSFAGTVALGGGGGAGSAGTNGKLGGSGGGGRGFIVSSGGDGTAGQGNDGGSNSISGSGTAGAGGGGKGSVGGNTTAISGGIGGSGYDAVNFGLGLLAGGGGGGAGNTSTFGTATAGGGQNAANAVANKGAGGAGGNSDGFSGSRAAGNGGSGIVSIRYVIPPPGSKVILGLISDKTEVLEGEKVKFTVTTENYENGETIPYFISGTVNQDDIDVPLIGNFVVNNNIAELEITTFKNDKTEGNETLELSIDGFSLSVLVLNFNPEYVQLSVNPSQSYSSQQSPSLIDLSDQTSNLTYIGLLNRDNLFKFLRQTPEFSFFTSFDFPRVVNLSDVDDILEIEILNTNNLYKIVIVAEESIRSSGRVFYSTDFVSITNFNVPEPEPLVFQERWAG